MIPKRCVILLLSVCSLSFSIELRSENRNDSTGSRTLREVVVTGARHPVDVRHLSQTVTVVGRTGIEESLQPSLLPVMNENVPGLFTTARGVLGYGVSGGAAGGISIRGLSGGSGQMMVLIDGHPQYAGIFGHPIADSYQSMLADRMEILRGPSSMTYGSNAMGGVVNIVTRRMHSDGVKTDLHAGYGSYNTLESELTNMTRFGRFSSVVSASYNRTDGHRSNMNFEQFGGYAKVSCDISSNWNAFADINITRFKASTPGPVNAPLVDGHQRITRGVTSFSLSNSYDRTSGALSFFYNFGKHWINDGYTPSSGQKSQDARFRSRDDMMGISFYQSASFFTGNRITAGFDWFRYGGKAWNDYVAGKRAGTRNQLVSKHEDEVAGYLDFRQDILRWLSFNAGVRFDHHSRAGNEWVPQAGLAFHLPEEIDIKGSASKGFRYPLLREMYMFPPQNPDLQPESMWNYEISFSQHLPSARVEYGVNLFLIDGKNMIQTLPNPKGNGMLNQNTGRIKNSGFELQGSWIVSSEWRVNANYSFLHMKNPVVAAPEHKLYAGASFSKGKWFASTGIMYIAGLYTRVSPDTQENFLLWNLRGTFRATGFLEIWVRGENLLASKYEINYGYPMPKATIHGGFTISF